MFVLDEPTAVLLPDEIAALLEVCRRVASSGRAVVLVTHKLAEIRKIADRVTVLRGGRVAGASDTPAADIDRLVRAMIQGNIEAIDTSAASIPLAFNQAVGDGRVKPGQLLLLEAMGGGLTWGACAIRF